MTSDRGAAARVAPQADVGVFGGSGLYDFLDDVVHLEVNTAFGQTSAPVAVGQIGATRVAFLPRHGRNHEFPPHRVPYRANIDVMRQLGVQALLAPCAAGSLQADIHPGDIVVCDQFVDRTWGRPDTFFDTFQNGPSHVSLADPYDDDLRSAVAAVAEEQGLRVHRHGTVVVVQGPRFSSRAESLWYRQNGWQVINMTQYPEVALAREAGIAYCGVALVTDYDAGVDGVPPVTQDEVFRVFDANVAHVRRLLAGAIPRVAALSQRPN